MLQHPPAPNPPGERSTEQAKAIVTHVVCCATRVGGQPLVVAGLAFCVSMAAVPGVGERPFLFWRGEKDRRKQNKEIVKLVPVKGITHSLIPLFCAHPTNS